MSNNQQPKNDFQNQNEESNSSEQDMSKLGKKGGKVTHEKRSAHEFTQQETEDGNQS